MIHHAERESEKSLGVVKKEKEALGGGVWGLVGFGVWFRPSQDTA